MVQRRESRNWVRWVGQPDRGRLWAKLKSDTTGKAARILDPVPRWAWGGSVACLDLPHLTLGEVLAVVFGLTGPALSGYGARFPDKSPGQRLALALIAIPVCWASLLYVLLWLGGALFSFPAVISALSVTFALGVITALLNPRVSYASLRPYRVGRAVTGLAGALFALAFVGYMSNPHLAYIQTTTGAIYLPDPLHARPAIQPPTPSPSPTPLPSSAPFFALPNARATVTGTTLPDGMYDERCVWDGKGDAQTMRFTASRYSAFLTTMTLAQIGPYFTQIGFDTGARLIGSAFDQEQCFALTVAGDRTAAGIRVEFGHPHGISALNDFVRQMFPAATGMDILVTVAEGTITYGQPLAPPLVYPAPAFPDYPHGTMRVIDSPVPAEYTAITCHVYDRAMHVVPVGFAPRRYRAYAATGDPENVSFYFDTLNQKADPPWYFGQIKIVPNRYKTQCIEPRTLAEPTNAVLIISFTAPYDRNSGPLLHSLFPSAPQLTAVWIIAEGTFVYGPRPAALGQQH